MQRLSRDRRRPATRHRPSGAGMVTVFTCYCLPTAICLMVYGLYTYLNPETRQAFVMGEAGRTKEDILAVFR